MPSLVVAGISLLLIYGMIVTVFLKPAQLGIATFVIG